MTGLRRLGILAAFLVTAISAVQASAARYADIVVDVATGKVLHAEDPDGLRYPASLTKMMTLYLAFDALRAGRLRLDTPLVVSAHAAGQSPSSTYSPPGTVLSVEEVIYAVAIKSANDAAVVMAEAIAGSESEFAEQMTRRARQLGMRSTTFANASGLPNPRQKTTARDLATLAIALLRDHPDRYHYFSAQSFYFQGKLIPSHNRLNASYEGADGIKTGFINASGFNLVTSAKRDGRRLVGVVLGGTSSSARDARMVQLLDHGFARANDGFAGAAMASLKSVKLPSLVGTAEAAPAPVPAPAPAKQKPAAKVVANLSPVVDADANNGTDRDWSIQVGAFNRPALAQKQLADATKLAPRLLGGRATAVLPIHVKGKDMHRARVVGLSEREARDACRALAKADQVCAVLPPSASRI